MESSPSFSPSFSFSPPTNDPFTRFLSIRTPLRGECWITLRKSVLDFLSRVTKQTLNRENSSCFSLFFGFCYSPRLYSTFPLPFSFSKEGGRGLYVGRKFWNRFFYFPWFLPLTATLAESEFFFAYL